MTVAIAASLDNTEAYILINGTQRLKVRSNGELEGTSTPAAGDNSKKLATTEYVDRASVPAVRNTVQFGQIEFDANATPHCIDVGTGRQPVLLATARAVTATFAGGYSAAGTVDLSAYVTADQQWPTVAANNTSFLSMDRVNGSAVTLGSSFVPPQATRVYNRSAQSKLDLNNNATDDFCNVWTNTGVTFSNTNPMLAGTYMGVFNGTSSYLKSTVFTSLYPAGNSGFTLRAKCKTVSLATAQYAFSALNSAGYGLQVWVSQAGKVAVSLSSNGTSYDIANATTGTTTVTVGQAVDVEVTQDSVAGKYYVYVNGVLDQTITSTARICLFVNMYIGVDWTGTALSYYWNGNIQGFEFLPYCLHPAGVSFTVPTTLSDITVPGYCADWYNTVRGQMYQVSGPSTAPDQNPDFTAVNRVYCGECTTNAASVVSVKTYAYNGEFDSGLFAVAANQTYTISHNMGTPKYDYTVTIADDLYGTNERMLSQAGTNGWAGFTPGPTTRNTLTINTTTNVGYNVSGQLIQAACYRIRAKRRNS